MSLIKETEKYLTDVVNGLGYDVDEVPLELSSKGFGDFQINVAMRLAKQNMENPIETAQKIVSKLDNRFINVNIAGPGFINLSFNKNIVLDYVNDSINKFDNFIDNKSNKIIFLDYGGANAAKTLHVGHMRSANIGEALRRLALLYNKKVISDVHLGDVGRQAGMIISEIQLNEPNLVFFDKNYKGEYPKYKISINDLNKYYPKANFACKKDPKRLEMARKITALIDHGDRGLLNLWKQIVSVSSREIKKTYDRLNCHFDLWEGELDALQYKEQILTIFKDISYISDGALVVDVKKEGDKTDFPPLILITSAGSTKYETRDLGSLYSRMERFHPDEIWYIVDARQKLYFESLFRGAYKSKLVPQKTKLIFNGFGTVNGTDGKPFKTRSGDVMPLEDLLDKVKNEITKKTTTINNEDIIEKLTIATVKYADLLPSRDTDYIFDINKFSSFEGKTGPYILYAMVRIKSILDKIDSKEYKIHDVYSSIEKSIYLKAVNLPKILENAYDRKSLSPICEYLFELCSLFNKFYVEHNIIHEQDSKKRESYIGLLHLVYNVGSKLLNILAIDVPDKM